MIRILCIETSEKVCSVALSIDGVCIDVLSENKENSHAKMLTILIDTLLKKHKLEISQLSSICVSAGPGSYTGLRIGVSTAKGMCWACDLPLLSLTSTEILVWEAKQLTSSSFDIYVAALDARRDEVFMAIHSQTNEILATHPKVLDNNPLNDFLDKQVYIVGSGAQKFNSYLKAGDQSNADIFPLASAMCALAFQKHSMGLFEDVVYFEPKYFKAVHTSKSTKKIFG